MDPKLKQLIQFIHNQKQSDEKYIISVRKKRDSYHESILMGRIAMCQDILQEAERLIFEEKP